MKITRTLYKVARLSADVGAVTSGKPRRIARRGANKAIGRGLGRVGFWRALFGGGRR